MNKRELKPTVRAVLALGFLALLGGAPILRAAPMDYYTFLSTNTAFSGVASGFWATNSVWSPVDITNCPWKEIQVCPASLTFGVNLVTAYTNAWTNQIILRFQLLADTNWLAYTNVADSYTISTNNFLSSTNLLQHPWCPITGQAKALGSDYFTAAQLRGMRWIRLDSVYMNSGTNAVNNRATINNPVLYQASEP